MLEYVPTRLVHQRRSEGWQIVALKPRDYAALMRAPDGWEPQLLADKKPYRTCTVPGCDHKHYAHGYCDMHNKRVQRLGSPFLPDIARYECSEAGCHKKRRGRGLCEMHLSRVRRVERKTAFVCKEAA